MVLPSRLQMSFQKLLLLGMVWGQSKNCTRGHSETVSRSPQSPSLQEA